MAWPSRCRASHWRRASPSRFQRPRMASATSLRCAQAQNSTMATRSRPRTSSSRSNVIAGTSHDLIKNRVAEVETPDPQHVRFKLKAPWPDFLTFYATATGAGWIVPKKYVEKVGVDGFKKAPVGAGPYKFVSFKPGVELVLEAFDQYWRKTP